MATLFFVDCEAVGGAPSVGEMTEFGIVVYPARATFHGLLIESVPDPKNPAKPLISGKRYDPIKVFSSCERWIAEQAKHDRPVMVSDNPAYDFMWMADGFWKFLGRNPFGHSARRISDFYAGLVGDWTNTQKWKHLRITPHDHNPVNDAMGNLEAFDRLMKGER